MNFITGLQCLYLCCLLKSLNCSKLLRHYGYEIETAYTELIFVAGFLPIFFRVFVTVLQNKVLDAFRTLLSTSPLSLEIFREEGIWDLIFSENFFYFEPASEETAGEIFAYNKKSELLSTSSSTIDTPEVNGVNSLQLEIISFLEFAATSNGNTHNMVGPYPRMYIFLKFLLFYEIEV